MDLRESSSVLATTTRRERIREFAFAPPHTLPTHRSRLSSGSSQLLLCFQHRGEPAPSRQRINASRGTPWSKAEKQGLVQLLVDKNETPMRKIAEAFVHFVRPTPIFQRRVKNDATEPTDAIPSRFSSHSSRNDQSQLQHSNTFFIDSGTTDRSRSLGEL